ncbi:MAG: prepilin-type N-terminal cleavage/methylation domain-containing protein [Planctomycetota bacterium]|jgi:prepilin-type N-terminal cleavage/methylation domain-containing protein|nr:prepilin-type N-terminal cleavage/methylation domain-containing protein [Planctomycetota bacterium]
MSAQRGFTSIELLVALSVVGILTAAAVPGVMSSVRRSQMADGVNAIVAMSERARIAAVSHSAPTAADPGWTADDLFGVVLHQRDGRYVVSMTRGTSAASSTIWSKNGHTSEVVLPAGVVIYSAASASDEPQPLSGDIGWSLSYRTGTTVVSNVAGAGLGIAGSPLAERLLLRSIDGELEAEIAIYPIGLGYGSEVRER